MNRNLRYAGLAVITLWLAQVVVVICVAMTALDLAGFEAGMTRVLLALVQRPTLIGALSGLAFMGIASHFSSFTARETEWVGPRSTARFSAFMLLTALAFGLGVVACLNVAFEPLFLALPRRNILLLMGALSLVLTGFMVMRAMRRFPSDLVRYSLQVFVGGLATGGAAAVLSVYRIGFLQRGTLLGVDAIVHLLYGNARSDLAQNAVGTTLFRVRIFPACSGVESMALGVLLLGIYLFLVRRHLRFPRAFLLFPVLISALALVNICRIVAYIAIGQHASQASIDAFHSATGWLAFAVTIALVIPVAEILLKLRIQGTDEVATPNDAAPYLVPLIASMLVAVALSVLALDATPFEYLRYLVAATAVFWFRRRIGDFHGSFGLVPMVVGALVAALYIVASPPNTIPPPFVAAVFEGANPVKVGAYVVGYALITPLVEELAFRGYLLRRIHSPDFKAVPFAQVGWPAILISSLAFGAMHGAILQGTLAGLAFGFVARKTGIRGAFVTHAVANGLLVTYAAFTHRLGVIG